MFHIHAFVDYGPSEGWERGRDEGEREGLMGRR